MHSRGRRPAPRRDRDQPYMRYQSGSSATSCRPCMPAVLLPDLGISAEPGSPVNTRQINSTSNSNKNQEGGLTQGLIG